MSEAPDRLLAALAGHVATVSPGLTVESIDPELGLLDAGYLDSLALADFVAILEREYGVSIDGDRLLADLYSLRALADWIVARGNVPE